MAKTSDYSVRLSCDLSSTDSRSEERRRVNNALVMAPYSSSSSSSFTMHDVEKHNREGDLWIVYDHKVYDVSPFVRRHPGGWKILVEHGGKDVTQLMTSSGVGPHRHSQAAIKMLNDYYIGDLQEALNGGGGGGGGMQSKTSNGQMKVNSKVRHSASTKKMFRGVLSAEGFP